MGALELAEQRGLEATTSNDGSSAATESQDGLTSLNGLRRMAALRSGTVTELRLLNELVYISRKTEEVIAPLAQLLSRSASALTLLDLSGAQMDTDEEIPALAATLPSLTSMSGLSLTSLQPCKLCSRGAALLLSKIDALPSLLALDIGENDLGPAGAPSLGQSLVGLSELQCLWARANGFGAEGATGLCQALAALTQMTHLDLGSNRLGEGGAIALKAGLAGMERLLKLFLEDNEVGPEGGRAVAWAMQGRTSLRELVLIHNDIGREVEQTIRAEWGLRVGGWRGEEELGLHLLKSDESS